MCIWLAEMYIHPYIRTYINRLDKDEWRSTDVSPYIKPCTCIHMYMYTDVALYMHICVYVRAHNGWSAQDLRAVAARSNAANGLLGFPEVSSTLHEGVLGVETDRRHP